MQNIEKKNTHWNFDDGRNLKQNPMVITKSDQKVGGFNPTNSEK